MLARRCRPGACPAGAAAACNSAEHRGGRNGRNASPEPLGGHRLGGGRALLVAIKLWALAATGALSVAASLADSALDLLASSRGLPGSSTPRKPPDEDHAFGHTSAEDLVALGQALLVAVSAGLIGWSAVGRLAAPQPLAAEEAGSR